MDERADETARPAVGVAVGVVVVGHGRSASELLHAARGIVGPEALAGVRAVDAGIGQTPNLGQELCDVIEQADEGAGVLVLVDLWGASPCSCVQQPAQTHHGVILSGLNLAMLLKVAALDRRRLGPEALAEACAESGRRAVGVHDVVAKTAGEDEEMASSPTSVGPNDRQVEARAGSREDRA